LAAKTVVLGLQLTQAPLKGLAGGTRDRLHTSIIGKAPTAAARPQLRSRDQLELDALIKYPFVRPLQPGTETSRTAGRGRE
jgi:hypothetical protein